MCLHTSRGGLSYTEPWQISWYLYPHIITKTYSLEMILAFTYAFDGNSEHQNLIWNNNSNIYIPKIHACETRCGHFQEQVLSKNEQRAYLEQLPRGHALHCQNVDVTLNLVGLFYSSNQGCYCGKKKKTLLIRKLIWKEKIKLQRFEVLEHNLEIGIKTYTLPDSVVATTLFFTDSRIDSAALLLLKGSSIGSLYEKDP